LNAGSAALDLVSAAAPLKGLKVLGSGGVEVIAAGSRAASAEAKVMLGALRDQIARVGGSNLTQRRATDLAREMLLRRFAAETIAFGGKPAQLAGLAVLAGSIAEVVLSIECDPNPSAEDKMRAYERLGDKLGKANARARRDVPRASLLHLSPEETACVLRALHLAEIEYPAYKERP
jgi:hypothetical protein